MCVWSQHRGSDTVVPGGPSPLQVDVVGVRDEAGWAGSCGPMSPRAVGGQGAVPAGSLWPGWCSGGAAARGVSEAGADRWAAGVGREWEELGMKEEARARPRPRARARAAGGGVHRRTRGASRSGRPRGQVPSAECGAAGLEEGLRADSSEAQRASSGSDRPSR